MNPSRSQFVEAIRKTEGLPHLLREHSEEVTGLEETRFDGSYIKFLDTQIELSPRGPEWTQRLKRRRAALLPFCDVTLWRGRVLVHDKDFTIHVHPGTRLVVHWEEYEG